MVGGSLFRGHICMVGDRQSFGAGRQGIHAHFLRICHISNSSVFIACGAVARRTGEVRAARPPFAIRLYGFRFCSRDTRAGEGGRRERKEPHDGKKLPIPTPQKPTRIFSAFMRHSEDFASSAAPQYSCFMRLFSVYQEQTFGSRFATKKVFVFAQNFRKDRRGTGISE